MTKVTKNQGGKEEERMILNLVLNVLSEKWDSIESRDPDQSTEKWRSYKCIRNTIRDTIEKLAKSRGIELY